MANKARRWDGVQLADLRHELSRSRAGARAAWAGLCGLPSLRCRLRGGGCCDQALRAAPRAVAAARAERWSARMLHGLERRRLRGKEAAFAERRVLWAGMLQRKRPFHPRGRTFGARLRFHSYNACASGSLTSGGRVRLASASGTWLHLRSAHVRPPERKRQHSGDFMRHRRLNLLHMTYRNRRARWLYAVCRTKMGGHDARRRRTTAQLSSQNLRTKSCGLRSARRGRRPGAPALCQVSVGPPCHGRTLARDCATPTDHH